MLWFTLESFYFKGMVERFDRENDWLEMSEDYAKVNKTENPSKDALDETENLQSANYAN